MFKTSVNRLFFTKIISSLFVSIGAVYPIANWKNVRIWIQLIVDRRKIYVHRNIKLYRSGNYWKTQWPKFDGSA